jgi:hypothetical protein
MNLSNLTQLSDKDLHIIANPILAVWVSVNGAFYPILSFKNGVMRVGVKGKAEVFQNDKCLTNSGLFMSKGTFADIARHC